MGKFTHEEARKALAESQDPATLASAVGSLGDDPATNPEELLPALDHLGYVAEQAAILLHRMTQTPWGPDGSPITSRTFWEQRLHTAKGGRRVTA